MKINEALNWGREVLEASGIEDAQLDAWYLLEAVTGMSKAAYLMEQRQEMDAEKLKDYEAAIKKREAHIPLQHITGSQDFMGFTFKVNEHVLIPRQDTETLVEHALKVVPNGGELLDLCTGSGCVMISILKHGNNLTGVAVDISKDALEVAAENAKALLEDNTYQLLLGDLWEPVEGRFDCIVSNPPYIPTDVITTLAEEVKGHEPLLALDGSADGLVFYRRICELATDYLKPGAWLLVEIGYDQGEAVEKLFTLAGFKDVEVVKDYCQNDRVVKGHL